jgi:hypothetical protein
MPLGLSRQLAAVNAAKTLKNNVDFERMIDHNARSKAIANPDVPPAEIASAPSKDGIRP